MIPLAADEDFDNRVVRGVLRKEPNMNLIRVQDAGLSGACDPKVLEWAAREGRVLFSHDANTMIKYAKRRLEKGLFMPGLFIAPRVLPTGDVVEDVLLVATLSLDGEYEGQIRFLPLK